MGTVFWTISATTTVGGGADAPGFAVSFLPHATLSSVVVAIEIVMKRRKLLC